jgi:hypothetical protein
VSRWHPSRTDLPGLGHPRPSSRHAHGVADPSDPRSRRQRAGPELRRRRRSGVRLVAVLNAVTSLSIPARLGCGELRLRAAVQMQGHGARLHPAARAPFPVSGACAGADGCPWPYQSAHVQTRQARLVPRLRSRRSLLGEGVRLVATALIAVFLVLHLTGSGFGPGMPSGSGGDGARLAQTGPCGAACPVRALSRYETAAEAAFGLEQGRGESCSGMWLRVEAGLAHDADACLLPRADG